MKTHFHNNLKLVLIVLLLVSSYVHSFASKDDVEPEITEYFSSPASLAVDSFITIFDNKSYNEVGTSNGSAYTNLGYKEYAIKNTAYLKLNEFVDSCFIDTFTFGVYLQVEHKDVNGNYFIDSIWLTINYDTSLLLKNREISSFIFQNALWSKITIIGFSNEQYKDFVEIGATQTIERYRDLNFTQVIALNTIEKLSATNQIKFSWNTVAEAEEYEFEWTWIDAIDENNGYMALTGLSSGFRNDATRVMTSDNSYAISNTYDKGYIVARVRPVGRVKDKKDQVTYAKWSDIDNTTETLVSYVVGKSLLVVASTQAEKTALLNSSWTEISILMCQYDSMNWQYVSTFAEEGKRKEVISYYDGSLRNRQSVTRISTGMQAVVGETIYDFEGRPAVNILPVPSFDQNLGFHPNFNVSARSSKSYDKADFDSIPTVSCSVNVAALSTVSGASKYYSANNNNVANRDAGFIPNAEGYPLTVTEYMPDGTGRIRRQGGVGTSHQLETEHETKYYYLVPGEQELDRLFGNAVGSYIHYQKEMVIDPNGQVSVSYKDLSGKVIATSLAGGSPDSMTALGSEANAKQTLSSKFKSTYHIDKKEISVTREIGVSDDNSKYKISYGLAIPRVTHEQVSDLCFNCVYNLEIRLVDECNQDMLDGDPNVAGNQPIVRQLGKVGQNFDVDCELDDLSYSFLTDASINDTFLTIYLDKGKYSLSKTLTIDTIGFKYYLDQFMNNLPLILDSFVSDAYAKEDTLSCELTCSECLTKIGSQSTYIANRTNELTAFPTLSSEDIQYAVSEEYTALYLQCQALCSDSIDACEGYYYTLLFDVMLKGQYAQYSRDEFGNLSYNGLLDASGTNGLSFNYKQRDSSGTWVDIQYVDANGDAILINVNGTSTRPNDLTVADYIKYFKEDWAANLVKYNPEYCKYEMCDLARASEEYSQDLLKVSNYQDAYDAGYFDPFSGSGQDPYFAVNSGAKTTFKTNYFDNFTTLGSPPCNVSILDVALMSQYSSTTLNNCTELSSFKAGLDLHPDSLCGDQANAVWEMYRGLFIAQKQKYFDAALGCFPTMPSGFTRRFPNPSQVLIDSLGVNTGNMNSESSVNSSKADVDNKSLASCDTICENQAEYWLYKLGGCNLDSTSKQALIDTFKVICKNGCDAEHPLGARNYPSSKTKRYPTQYYSFQEAFNAMVPESAKTGGECDVWLINTPSYSSTLFKLAGIPDSCLSQTTDSCFQNATADQQSYTNYKRIVDGSGCSDCIDCDQFDLAMDSLHSYYGVFLDSSWATKEILTNFMNSYFAFNLNYFDYEKFMTECYGGKKAEGTIASNFLGSPKEEFDLEWQPPYLGEYLYASTDPYPIIENIYDPHAPKTYYIDTCVCNNLQDFLDQLEPGNPALVQRIKNGTFTPSDVNALDSLLANLTSCYEFQTGTTSDFTKALLKCRNIYSSINDQDLGTSSSHWGEYDNQLLNALASDLDSDSTQFTLNSGSCLTPCSAESGEFPGDFNSFWTSNTDYFPVDSNPCAMFDLEGMIDSIMEAKFGAMPSGQRIAAQDCFEKSFCNLGWGNAAPANRGASCFPSDSIGDPGNRVLILDIFEDIWSSFNAKYNNAAENQMVNTGFTHWQNGKPLMYFIDSPSIWQKMELLSQDFCYDPCWGDGGDTGTVYTTRGPNTSLDSTTSCCGKETIYFKKLLSYLNGFTASKNYCGNQFSPRSGYSIYPDMSSYYASPFYQNGQHASLTFNIEYFKYPLLHYTLKDAYGDVFHTALAYTNSYNNKANFSKITSFESFKLLPTNYADRCANVSRFIVYAKQITASGQTIDVVLKGSISTYDLYQIKELNPGEECHSEAKLCNRPFGTLDIVLPDPCKVWKKTRAETTGKMAYDAYRDSLENDFKVRYYRSCMAAQDSMNMEYDLKEYHYTLYYYDQAGNLIQTVPPAGVNMLTTSTDLAGVVLARGNSSNPSVFPSHNLVTRYKYNSLNEVRHQVTPDGGTSEFWYDRLGRMAVSQNAKQANQSPLDYSYTLYDYLGRIEEVGQISQSIAIDKSIAFNNSSLSSWIAQGNKEQITRTWYDYSLDSLSVDGFEQENLRGRVTTMAYFDYESESYQHAVHYSYDIHGNVKILDRENSTLAFVQQDHKLIEYDYDLVSGNVNYVYYQKGKDDQFTHNYLYDADNRLTNVFTSADMVHWDEDAAYYYYLHGPLSRVELGGLKVQGIDYAYTLHGWLKGVNSNNLHQQRDIGQDGHQGSINSNVARDVFGFSLHYYNDDYKPISGAHTSSKSDYFLMEEPATAGFNNQVTDLFNGNISRMVTALDKLSNTVVGKAYEYDQLNRISKSFTFTNYSITTNKWLSGGPNADFYSDYTYDANGNLLTLNRNAGSGVAMDSLSYYYIPGSNQLSSVKDQVAAGLFSHDIDDQNIGNYSYDKIGNLISDEAEEIIDIQWTAYGKIKSITRLGSSLPSNIGKRVTYTNLIGVTQDLTTGVLTKGSTDSYAHGAQSQETINADGALEWTILGPPHESEVMYVGLAYEEGTYDEMDFGWYIGIGSVANVRHLNANYYNVGPVNEGDVLKVERKGNTIRWFVNGGVPVYQMQETQNGDALIADITMYQHDTKLNKLTIFGASDTTNGVSDKPNLQFEYSPDGHRVAKHVTQPSGSTNSTWYVRDASGNIMSTYSRTWYLELDTSLIDTMEIYEALVADQSYDSRVAFLDQALNWNTWATSHLPLDQLEDSILNGHERDFLNYFDPETYLASGSWNIFDGVYNSQTTERLILALRAAGYGDMLITETLCNTCFDVYLKHLVAYNHADFLNFLHMADMSKFDHIVNSLGLNPMDPPMVNIANITNAISSDSTAEILISLGNDCTPFNTVYDQMIGYDNSASLDHLSNTNTLKSCIKNAFTQAEIADAWSDYYGTDTLWEYIFLAHPGTEHTYVADIKQSNSQAFLSNGFLALQDEEFLRSFVQELPGPSVTGWLEAVKQHYGVEYYNNLLLALTTDNNTSHWKYKLNEQHIYGSSRIGLTERNLLLAEQIVNTDSVEYFTYHTDSIRTFYRGQKRYELSNHLGNVLAVITDRRIQACGAGDVMHYEAQVVSVSDYYPFGMGIKEREWKDSSFGYRFGFNGKEQDNSVKGQGNSYDFGARIYDSRLGRWMITDPLQKKYPSLSPYNFVANSPILFIDPDGRVIDLGNLTPEQKIQYKALLDKLSKSELHNYVQNALESSSNTYIIVIDNDMKAGGSFNPETGVIKMNLTVMNNVPEIASEEMFHAYQKDRLGENHSEVSKQNIEAEGDLYVLYVQNELYGELGLRVDFGHLDNDLVADLGVNDGTTTSEDMSTEDYRSLYGQLVQKRYEKYKDDPKAPSSYKKEPSGDASSTLIKATKEKEANEQKLEGPKLENVDYYGS